MSRVLFFRLWPWVFILAGCAPKAAVKTGIDFSKIRRVAVRPFQGTGGAEAMHELVRQLVARGLQVTDGRQKTDAVLSGAVTAYQTDYKLTVFLGNLSSAATGGSAGVVTNPVVSPGGSWLNGLNLTVGSQNPQMVSVIAAVGIDARLIDPGTGHVIWADSASYESLEAPDALQSAAAALVGSLQRVIPVLSRSPA